VLARTRVPDWTRRRDWHSFEMRPDCEPQRCWTPSSARRAKLPESSIGRSTEPTVFWGDLVSPRAKSSPELSRPNPDVWLVRDLTATPKHRRPGPALETSITPDTLTPARARRLGEETCCPLTTEPPICGTSCLPALAVACTTSKVLGLFALALAVGDRHEVAPARPNAAWASDRCASRTAPARPSPAPRPTT
jgi:hypothetical protein